MKKGKKDSLFKKKRKKREGENEKMCFLCIIPVCIR
jgi:hypothetical protein